MIFGDLKRWMYRDGHPGTLARFLNRIDAAVARTGHAPYHVAALEVVGRKTGRTLSLPVVVAFVDGQRYLVSMLGDEAQWVRNVRAAQGEAALVTRQHEPVRLVEVPVEQRAPLIKAYLKVAPGARPHIAIDKDAPVADFEPIAATVPVFRITSRSAPA